MYSPPWYNPFTFKRPDVNSEPVYFLTFMNNDMVFFVLGDM